LPVAVNLIFPELLIIPAMRFAESGLVIVRESVAGTNKRPLAANFNTEQTASPVTFTESVPAI